SCVIDQQPTSAPTSCRSDCTEFTLLNGSPSRQHFLRAARQPSRASDSTLLHERAAFSAFAACSTIDRHSGCRPTRRVYFQKLPVQRSPNHTPLLRAPLPPHFPATPFPATPFPATPF